MDEPINCVVYDAVLAVKKRANEQNRTIADVCKDKDMPSKASFYRWQSTSKKEA